MVQVLKQSDEAVERVADALRDFQGSHPDAECLVYRYNPAAIRVRIVDQAFTNRNRGQRHDYAMKYLGKLPEDTLAEVSILLCLAPGEASMLDGEFAVAAGRLLRE